MKYLTFLALAIASLVVAAALPNTLSRPLDISSMISGPKSLSDVVPLAHFDKKIELGNLRGECEPRLHCPLPRPTYPERLCEVRYPCRDGTRRMGGSEVYRLCDFLPPLEE
ncbi:hypothetical protein AUEXF2481DRAFT_30778 [Aureobasidium subglaciale EXF-2481]|uniref:Uncharacterized protein n=1 Tax=Aureobasidium subglaciale (strain EXF-2481) TaxID=1043005 RepID=A0A074YJH7_AURSE|nr:uncharacterized protein AUEXF2481DRAFT_30778 [Aureobasidium subglaciale EXF-2481]KEQ94242.1 hypothetical protein AUEXF2481DRAFT_30778 [Aureobasidium subglaciale EXF-2481]